MDMFCPKCGAKVSEEDNYCHKCGSPLKKTVSSSHVPELGINIITRDNSLQEYWIKRCIAYVIDSIIVSCIVFILGLLFFLPQIIFEGRLPSFDIIFPIGFLSLIYFTLLEYAYGCTFGKKLMNFKIESEEKKTFLNTFIRNLSKIFWILLLLDVVGGLITPGDPTQKYSDRLVKMHVKSEYSPTFRKSNSDEEVK
ncbi:MAG: RDD family protein [Nitrososphaeria archaeon]|nr:RDD family protein [Nitrososphaeria archaeon]